MYQWLIDCRTAWARGSRDRTNNVGERGQPCWEPLDMGNCLEQVLPINTIAVGSLHKVWIIDKKLIPKPTRSKTCHRKCHSRRSKAFSASSDKIAFEQAAVLEASMMWSRPQTLSEAKRFLMKPVWSEWVRVDKCNSNSEVRTSANNFVSAFKIDIGR